MTRVSIKEVKRGEFFTLKPSPFPKESQVYVRGEYDRSARRYDCGKFSDISMSRLFSGRTMVYIDFIF